MDHDAAPSDDARPGCAPARLPGMLARLVLVYPVLSMSSQLGRWVQRSVRPAGAAGTAYEGALLGLVIGCVIGMGLWWRSRGPDGWRSATAQLALVLSALVWLASVALTSVGVIRPEEALAAYALSLLVGSAILAVIE